MGRKELQYALDARAGIKDVRESDDKTHEIMEMKIKLEKIQNGINSLKGVSRSRPVLLFESLQHDLDFRVAAEEAIPGKEKSDRELLSESFPKKSAKKEESATEIKESSTEISEEVEGVVNLQESAYSKESNELVFTLVENGGKYSREDFVGYKMFSNRQTAAEKRERPERSLKDWIGTIIEAFLEKGKLMVKAAIHDKNIRELLSNPVSRKALGILINDGSVDLVTEK